MPGRGQHNDFDLMRYADLGIRLALIAGVFLYGGWRLDAWLGTGPWLLLLGCLVGFAGGMYSVVLAVDSAGRKRPGPHPPDGKGKDGADERP